MFLYKFMSKHDVSDMSRRFNYKLFRNRRMSSRGQQRRSMLTDQNYKEALSILHRLVSNSEARSKAVQYPKTKAEENLELFNRAGISLDQLDSLNVIHIAGTKGKGSTSAMCESILRHSGLKTGLFTSPHLIEVRERIQINRKLLSEDQFARYFWDCYRLLENGKNNSMPVYFGFLTVMACYAFLKEEVDVVIMEVGLGGEYDTTNVIRSPHVCGITTLGMDHTEILGCTLTEIAWQKAGIFKFGRPAFTVPQKGEAIPVLCGRAKEIGVKSFKEVPPLSAYGMDNLTVGLLGEHQLLNASLAVQLCKTWMEESGKWPTTPQSRVDPLSRSELAVAETFQLPPSFLEGLEKVRWSGRSHTVKEENVTFYLDAAHNVDSIPVSARWFKATASTETQSMSSSVQVYRLLLFNVTKGRDSKLFLDILKDCTYDFVLFCPNIMTHDHEDGLDSSKVYMPKEKLMESVYKNSQVWMELRETCKEAGISLTDNVKCFECISCALTWMKNHVKHLERSTSGTSTGDDKNSKGDSVHLQVHVTGSSHLVGDVLAQLGYTADDL